MESPVGAVTRYGLGAVCVRLADEGARVALVLLALQRSHSAGLGGVLVAALLLPHVAAAPVVGLLIDRAGRPCRAVALGALGLAGALAWAAVALGRLPAGLVVAGLLAGGACGPAVLGGLSSQVSSLVGEQALPRAFGLDSLSYNVAGIAGPALAAMISAAAGPAAAVIALAVCSAAGAAVIATLPVSGSAADGAPPRVRDGAALILHDRVLGVVTGATTLAQLGLGGLPVVAAVLAGRLAAPDAGGWLLAALAAGGLLGSLAWTWRPAGAGRAPTVAMAALFGLGAPLAVAAAVPSLAGLLGAFAIAGFCIGPLTGALFTTREARAPAQLRAQTFSLGAGLKTTAAAAGAALAGAAGGAGTTAQLLLVAACPLAAGALGLLALPRAGLSGPARRSPRVSA